LNAAQQAVTCIPDVRTVSLYLAVVVEYKFVSMGVF
jgi:hypothetical protein